MFPRLSVNCRSLLLRSPQKFPQILSNHLINHLRNLSIRIQTTPNTNALQFFPGKTVLDGENSQQTANFDSKSAQSSPLAERLFQLNGVGGVFFGKDFVTVTKSEDIDWNLLTPEIEKEITQFFESGEPIFKEKNNETSNHSSSSSEQDSEIVAKIKDLLDMRIRPTVQEDGGDIYFHRFEESTGVVYLKLVGACGTCSSSSITLKNGVENMMMYYIPEVHEVVQVEDEVDKISAEVFESVESKTRTQ
eukprot:c9262_g1_i1.p1 GENE.c9262_g1_i1~~c9262_g1_i1.p1  ORF type:complete len:248 (+),score=109.07 c9262_g1_i1:2-745(+)